MTAHIAGAPVEELLLPILSSGGVLVLALRTALGSRRRNRPTTPASARAQRRYRR
jgi:hypothetical protein